MRRAVGVMILLGTLGTVEGFGFPSWSFVRNQIAREFPSVRQITTAELSAWLEDGRRSSPLLLDVRTEKEFSVSHLRGARRVDPDALAAELDLPHDVPIVTYCSVGYRSSKLAQRLQEAGYRKVWNLDGSLFQWANENRPMVRGGMATDKVHPYNWWWGRLLKRGHAAAID